MTLSSFPTVFRNNYRWVLRDVLTPFLFTRVLLLAVAWLAQYFPFSRDCPAKEAIARGWVITPYRSLDIWARWDSGWYCSIMHGGYVVNGRLDQMQSNIAFFPLYPYLVKALAYVLPPEQRDSTGYVVIGLLLSTAFFLSALVLLYKLTLECFDRDAATARRVIWYVLLFPTSFLFSCIYPESAFLFFSVAAFLYASRREWALAGVMGGLLALTRPLGVLIAAPLAWAYMDSIGWNLRKLRLNLLWLALAPLALLGHMLYMRELTGTLFAHFQIQQAWGRGFAWPWQTLLHPALANYFITPLEQVCAVSFLLLAAMGLFMMHNKSYSLYALLLMTPPLFTGSTISIVRFNAVVFPVFMVLGLLGRSATVDRIIMLGSLALQVVLMIAWCRLYWVQ